MSDGNIKLRFVTENDFISSAIRFQAGLSVPFVPSHVECVIPLDWPDQSIADGGWANTNLTGW